MSNLETSPAVSSAGGDVTPGPVWEVLAGRDVVLGGARAMGTDGLAVSRTLPNRDRRMVGAWCFVDHFGSADIGPSGPAVGSGMHVPPHPHTGLQTVTWLLEGGIVHHDSLGTTQAIAPGQLNLMTAGRGIAHAEVSPADPPAGMHGVQLWVALPDTDRAVEPHFAHHADLPRLTDGGATVTVLMGSLAGAVSPAQVYSPLVGAEVALAPGARVELPLDPHFEYAVLPLGSALDLAGARVDEGAMVYLGRGRRYLDVGAPSHTNDVTDRHVPPVPLLLLLGGEPFEEKIVMWWNFIGRDHDEIVQDRTDWMAGRRFDPVQGYDGDPLPAPELPTTPLLPRGRTR